MILSSLFSFSLHTHTHTQTKIRLQMISLIGHRREYRDRNQNRPPAKETERTGGILISQKKPKPKGCILYSLVSQWDISCGKFQSISPRKASGPRVKLCIPEHFLLETAANLAQESQRSQSQAVHP